MVALRGHAGGRPSFGALAWISLWNVTRQKQDWMRKSLDWIHTVRFFLSSVTRSLLPRGADPTPTHPKSLKS